MQFDADQGLPPSVNVLAFAAARAKEIQTMKQALSTAKKSKLIFQTLPTHMRRRVMSHNVKRLPRRLREAHLKQLQKSGALAKHKRPCRKFRRRPKNLLSEYARRRRRVRWLETHIWHAKRFHMVERWGYKLPESPCDKSFRACYRASARHCLIQDISYVTCIEISGRESLLTERLKSVCDVTTGPSIVAKAYIRGNREGRVMLFKSKKAVGFVDFIWRPIEVANGEESARVLWIWAHAAYHDEVLMTFIELFELRKRDSDEKNVFINSENGVVLKNLRDELSRFRLTGPLSQAVLQKALKPVCLNTINSKSLWLQDYLKNEKELSAFNVQVNYWKSIENLSSPSYLSPHIILSLVATDPRYNFPKRRTKAITDNVHVASRYIQEVPEDVGVSPIWDENVREEVKGSKISNAKLAEMRSELLVPGTDLSQPGAAVPYLLVQRPGNRDDNAGYCSGWDLIVPSGWAQATWITLIMWGARAGGLRETDSMTFEMGQPHHLKPDTAAGLEEERHLLEHNTRRYFSLPPNKRTNYTKLAIASPFKCDWNVLIDDWKDYSEPVDDFCVLRNRKTLQEIQEALSRKNYLKIDYSTNFIIPVKLRLENKGLAKPFAIICLPNVDDYRNKSTIQEPLRCDENQATRKEMRDLHKQLLKRMRRQRVKAKRNGKVVPVDPKIIIEFKEKMRNLWLPPLKKNIRQSCSREVIGFVTKGDFSFTEARGIAVGYIALGTLPELLARTHRNKVLVRNTTSRQYRKATMQIVI